jgi:hypothetical protein
MFSHSTGAPGHPSALAPQDEPADGRYEYRQLTLPRGTSRADARALLTEHAEYGRWELATVTLYRGGARSVRLRRRILRVQRTL